MTDGPLDIQPTEAEPDTSTDIYPDATDYPAAPGTDHMDPDWGG